jgi:hypothetical protein
MVGMFLADFLLQSPTANRGHGAAAWRICKRQYAEAGCQQMQGLVASTTKIWQDTSGLQTGFAEARACALLETNYNTVRMSQARLG